MYSTDLMILPAPVSSHEMPDGKLDYAVFTSGEHLPQTKSIPAG